MSKFGEMYMYAMSKHVPHFKRRAFVIRLKCFYLSCLQNARDKTEDIRKVVEQYDNIEFIPLRIEDAFDRDWWIQHGGDTGFSDIALDITNEGKVYAPSEVSNSILIHYVPRSASHINVKYAISVTTGSVTPLSIVTSNADSLCHDRTNIDSPPTSADCSLHWIVTYFTGNIIDVVVDSAYIVNSSRRRFYCEGRRSRGMDAC
jgi:hypothetical protein